MFVKGDKKCKSAKKTYRWSKKIKNVLEENQKKLVKKKSKRCPNGSHKSKSGKNLIRKVKKASAKPVKKASAKPVKKLVLNL